jgi:ATP-dependent Zn protease
LKQGTRQKTQFSIAYIEQAKEETPCIVSIDELDAVGESRGAGPVS